LEESRLSRFPLRFPLSISREISETFKALTVSVKEAAEPFLDGRVFA
jgi:hypothetical protein